jgi:cytochrome P450
MKIESSLRLSGTTRDGRRRELDDLPGPRGLPLLGNLHQIDSGKLHLILEGWAAEYGPTYQIRIGRRRLIVITDPRHCDQILRARPETFSRGAIQSAIFSEMNLDGVFSSEGDSWRRQRKLTAAALAQRNLRGLYSKIQTVTLRLLERWRRQADAGVALDLVDELKRYTVDVTTLLTFGYDANSIERDDDLVQRKLDLVFPTLIRRLFAPFPLWRYVRLPKDRQFEKALAELRTWLDELIGAARAKLAAAPELAERPSNFVEAMVATRDDEGNAFSDDVIFANLMHVLLAGEDTTANTLSWAVHHLLDSPERVAPLREEAERILGSSEAASSVEMASKLDWAAAIANETMRLRPVGPVMGLTAKVETWVGDLVLSAGTGVVLLTRPAAIDPEHFGDPLAFRPERWLGQPEGPHEVSVLIPFGAGPRMCPGRSLAFLEINTLLSMLYKNFEVDRAGDSDEVQEEFGFTMSPVGLKVRMRRRSSGAR